MIILHSLILATSILGFFLLGISVGTWRCEVNIKKTIDDHINETKEIVRKEILEDMKAGRLKCPYCCLNAPQNKKEI